MADAADPYDYIAAMRTRRDEDIEYSKWYFCARVAHMIGERSVTVMELSRRLGVSREMVRLWVSRGRGTRPHSSPLTSTPSVVTESEDR